MMMFLPRVWRLKRFLVILMVVFGGGICAWADDSVVYEMPYVDGGDAAQRLDIYRPKGAGAEGARYPVLIYVHGGAWRYGDKSRERTHGEFFAERGVVFVAIDYRLAPAHMHPAQIEDVAAAVKWVVDHIGAYGGDAQDLNIAGHSAGAQLAALVSVHLGYLGVHGLGLDVFKVVMGVDTASYDLTKVPAKKGTLFVARAIAQAFGRNKKDLEDASPTLRVQALSRKESRGLPVFKLFTTSRRVHGVLQTQAFYRAVKKAGGEVQQYIVSGASHSEMKDHIADERHLVGREMLKAIKN